MRKVFFLLFFFFCYLFKVVANYNDTVFTVYRNSEFITTCSLQVNASDSISKAVVNDFLHQTRYDLDELYKWALKGLNLRGEKNELIVFNFKSTSYNKETGVIHGLGDVTVPYVTTFRNIAVDSKMEKVKTERGNILVNINVLYSDAFLKKTYGYFSVRHLSNSKSVYTLETHVEFGWFFDFFITQSRFKKIMEWRFERLLKNIKTEAEKREKQRQRILK